MTATTVATPNGYNAYIGPSVGGNREVIHETMSAELATTSLDDVGDVVWLGYIPAGAVVVDYFVKVDDLDTGTSLAFIIGDGTTTNFFFSSAATTTAAQAGGVISPASTTTVKYTKYASATRIRWTTATAAQTAAAGTVIFGVSYFMDPEFSVTTGPAPY